MIQCQKILYHILRVPKILPLKIYLSMLHTLTNFLAAPCHCIYSPLQTFFVRFPTLGNFFYPPYKKKVSHYTQLLCTEKSLVQVNRSIFWHRKSFSGYDKLPYADDNIHLCTCYCLLRRFEWFFYQSNLILYAEIIDNGFLS